MWKYLFGWRSKVVDGVVLERVRFLHDAIEAVGLRREQPPPVLGRI